MPKTLALHLKPSAGVGEILLKDPYSRVQGLGFTMLLLLLRLPLFRPGVADNLPTRNHVGAGKGLGFRV